MYHTRSFQTHTVSTQAAKLNSKHDAAARVCCKTAAPHVAFAALPHRLHRATGDAGYLKDAEAFYDRSKTTEKFTNPNPDRLSYENVIPALHLMLYQVGPTWQAASGYLAAAALVGHLASHRV